MTPKQTFYKSWHWDLLKTVQGRVLTKHDTEMKTHRKINYFWWSKTIGKYCETRIYIFRSFKYVKKMSKMILQVMSWDQKWWHWRPMPDLSSDLYRLGAMWKKSKVVRWSNKSEKSVQWSFQDVFDVKDILLWASGVPRAAPFLRTRSSGKRYKERRRI